MTSAPGMRSSTLRCDSATAPRPTSRTSWRASAMGRLGVAEARGWPECQPPGPGCVLAVEPVGGACRVWDVVGPPGHDLAPETVAVQVADYIGQAGGGVAGRVQVAAVKLGKDGGYLAPDEAAAVSGLLR